MATVTLKDVRKSYGAVNIIQGVDLAIQDREFVVFAGPSGCGKSTLLRMIAGLEEISGGDLLIDGAVVNDLSTEAVIHSVTIASGLGASSAYTWMKLPVVDEMERVMAATTLPTLLLGGDNGTAPDETYRSWERALALPGVRGLTVGRTLLYPHDDDVETAIDTAARLVHPAS